MGLKRMTSYFSDSVAIDFEGAARCDLRIELPDRPGRRIPRIGEKGFTRFLPLAVKLAESIKLHDHFSPDLQSSGDRDLPSNELKRNGFDGAEIPGDVLTVDPVASGGADHKLSPLINEFNGQAIELGFGHILNVRRGPKEFLDPFIKFFCLGFIEGIGKAEHGEGMGDDLECF